ncbi:MAG TPA: competence/damage-inducible protein A [Candidatus Binataceae bacterium]|nr:competence/damage-inducible protein A [Candidatus Binataceae bacterium]
MRDRTAALVVVGNEILSGKIQDSNAFFTTREFRKAGIDLRRISVIPDDLDTIAEEVSRCSARFDFVVTSGGVGPTHDDLTIEGVARAFSRKIVMNPVLEKVIRDHMGDRVNAAMLKMAQVPEGAVLNEGGDVRFPTVQIENVYILPGIPQLFESKLLQLIPRFGADPYHIRTIYSRAIESSLAEHLNNTMAAYPDLMLGSYPRIGDPEYRVKLTLESKDPEYLERALKHLLKLLPADAVVKVD